MRWYMFLWDIKNTAHGWLYYTLLCSKPFSTPVLSEPPQAENLAPLRGNRAQASCGIIVVLHATPKTALLKLKLKLVEVFAVGREEVRQKAFNLRKVGSQLVDSDLCGFVGAGEFRIADRGFFHTFDKSR